jgi:hypothetical protein
MEASKTNPRTCVLPWCNRNSDEGRSFSRLPTDTKFRAHLKCHKSVDNDPFFARIDVLEGKEMRVCREHITRVDGRFLASALGPGPALGTRRGKC